jgi:hypothetical protein
LSNELFYSLNYKLYKNLGNLIIFVLQPGSAARRYAARVLYKKWDNFITKVFKFFNSKLKKFCIIFFIDFFVNSASRAALAHRNLNNQLNFSLIVLCCPFSGSALSRYAP